MGFPVRPYFTVISRALLGRRPPILGPMAASDWPKVCACGAAWSEEDWSDRPLVGQMALSDDEPPLELRHCMCGSTIAVLMPGAAPE
jgi:hypothetical protein